MFSSTNNNFETFPSSSYNPPLLPLYNIGPGTENAFAIASTILDHDTPFMPSTSIQPPIRETATNLMVSDDYGGAGGGSVPARLLIRKKAAAGGGGAKKERHSKIFTSQGLRDRRVRLSREIARKFFDLQDMLQCDKPSNTLQWLFTKSDSAIKELSHNNSLGSSVGSKLKYCGEEETAAAAAALPQTLHQLMMQPPRLESRDLKPDSLMYYSHCQSFDEIPKGNSYNTSNYRSCSCPNSPPNWDASYNEASFGGGIASMNLSTELQIFGKSWEEECAKQGRH